MNEEKKNDTLDDDTLEAVSGGSWSAPSYKDYGLQKANDSADQVNGQLAADGNMKQQP